MGKNVRWVDVAREGSLSYEDYAALPGDERYELSNGVLELMSPSPSPVHQLVCKSMTDSMERSCGSDFIFLISPIDVILGSKEVRQPDIVAVHRSRVEIITQRGVEGRPDFVVEIVSPSSVRRDREEKLLAYAYYGIPEYWIVVAELSCLEQYVLENGAYRLQRIYVGDEKVRSTVMPCAHVSMAEVLDKLPDLPGLWRK